MHQCRLEVLGSGIEETIGQYCDLRKVNYFATSALGFIPGTQNPIPVWVGRDGAKPLYPAEPIALFKPFLWIQSLID